MSATTKQSSFSSTGNTEDRHCALKYLQSVNSQHYCINCIVLIVSASVFLAYFCTVPCSVFDMIVSPQSLHCYLLACLLVSVLLNGIELSMYVTVSCDYFIVW